MLPQNDYSRRTYISENALLPGQVHTYFGGSDQDIFRAYKHEVDALASADSGLSNYEVNDALESMFKGVGLKVGQQNFTYSASGREYKGENVYAILHAPRGDATEAIVLVAAWRNVKDEANKRGVALLLTLARYFRRWSLWSKDIIFVITPDSLAGPQAWVDAYHDAHDTRYIDSLPLKSGALQGALAVDYSQETRFSSVHIVYDGINGQLPNLDLINSVVSIAGGQMGIGVSIQEMWAHSDSYEDRLKTMLRGMMKQGLGMASGPHSCFIPYHVDAVTLRPYGDGWQDEMAMGRVIEGTFRSLNNLLEHLHQSFFFYLLMHRDRFVSIGTYLPSAMLIAANFTIVSISLWVKSGQSDKVVEKPTADNKDEKEPKKERTVDKGTADALMVTAEERDLLLPLVLVAGCQFLGVVPFYVLNHVREGVSSFLAVPFPQQYHNQKREREWGKGWPWFTDHHVNLDAHTRLRHLCPGKHYPSSRHLPPPKHPLSPLGATIRPHAVLFPFAFGNVPVHACHAQLLPRPHCRDPLVPFVLCASLPKDACSAVVLYDIAQPGCAHGGARDLVRVLAEWKCRKSGGGAA